MGLQFYTGSFGVTEVKKAIYTKITTFLTVYMAWSCDSYTNFNLRHPTYIRGQKVNPRSLEVTVYEIYDFG